MASGQSEGELGASEVVTPSVAPGTGLVEAVREVLREALAPVFTPSKGHRRDRHHRRYRKRHSSSDRGSDLSITPSKRKHHSKSRSRSRSKSRSRSSRRSKSPSVGGESESNGSTGARLDPVAKARAQYWKDDSTHSLSASDDQEGELSGEDESAGQKPIKRERLCPPDMFHKVMAKAASAIDLVVEEAPPQPTTLSHRAKSYPRNTPVIQTIPFPEALEDIFQVEWESLAKPRHFRLFERFYTLPKPVMKRLAVPSVDPPVVAVSNATMLPSEGEQGPKDACDKRVESAFKRGFEAAAQTFRACVAGSTFSRAILVWTDELLASERGLSKRAKSTLKKMALSAAAAGDCAYDSMQMAARGMASSVAGRRQLWLRQWPGDSASTSRILNLPFKGEKLFGEELDPMLVEDSDKRKVLPNKKVGNTQTKRPQPFRTPSTGFKPKPNFQSNRQKWSKPRAPFKYRKGSGSSSTSSAKGKSDQQAT